MLLFYWGTKENTERGPKDSTSLGIDVGSVAGHSGAARNAATPRAMCAHLYAARSKCSTACKPPASRCCRGACRYSERVRPSAPSRVISHVGARAISLCSRKLAGLKAGQAPSASGLRELLFHVPQALHSPLGAQRHPAKGTRARRSSPLQPMTIP